jgi:hypothetical protein
LTRGGDFTKVIPPAMSIILAAVQTSLPAMKLKGWTDAETSTFTTVRGTFPASTTTQQSGQSDAKKATGVKATDAADADARTANNISEMIMETRIQNLFLAFGLAVAFFFGQAQATTIFPIATNNADSSASMALDGTNYLVGIQGDYAGPSLGYYITAQMFGPTGALIGSRINPVPGHTTSGWPLTPFTACSGSNYLMVWPDNYLAGSYSSISGQLISPSGGLIDGMIAITTNSQQGMCSVAYGGGKYLVVWNDFTTTPNGAVYGQLVSTAGALLGGSFVIGADVYGQGADDASAAFDGTNFLVGWTLNFSGGSHNVTYGVFISPSGTMGTPFAIGQTASANLHGPPFLIFNGTNYLAVWNYQSAPGNPGIVDIHGRFVTPSGTFPGNEFVIVTNARIAGLAFDGANYLQCSSVNLGATNSNVQFQFLNSGSQPTGPQFTPFKPQGNEVPLVASLLYDGKRFVSAATLAAGGGFINTINVSIYGTFIPASTAPPQLAVAAPFANHQFSLTLAGTPGLNYAIQAATNLPGSNWMPLVTNSPTNGTFSFTDTSATNSSRFYRAVKQ